MSTENALYNENQKFVVAAVTAKVVVVVNAVLGCRNTSIICYYSLSYEPKLLFYETTMIYLDSRIQKIMDDTLYGDYGLVMMMFFIFIVKCTHIILKIISAYNIV